MPTLHEDLAAAETENSPSVAAALKAAIDKQPAEAQEPEAPAEDLGFDQDNEDAGA